MHASIGLPQRLFLDAWLLPSRSGGIYSASMAMARARTVQTSMAHKAKLFPQKFSSSSPSIWSILRTTDHERLTLLFLYQMVHAQKNSINNNRGHTDNALFAMSFSLQQDEVSSFSCPSFILSPLPPIPYLTDRIPIVSQNHFHRYHVSNT